MFFDVVDITDRPLGESLLAIKILANKRLTKSAHITIGGPFQVPSSNEVLVRSSKILDNTRIVVGQVGYFLNEKSKVIFLKCSAPDLKKVWNKPSYPIEKYGFNPHLTIYDGEDSFFAKNLFKLLEKYNDRTFDIVSPKLSVLLPTTEYDFLQRDALNRIGCNIETIQEMNDNMRLEKIEQVLQIIFLL